MSLDKTINSNRSGVRPSANNNLQAFLGLSGVLAPLLFNATVLVLGFFFPGYSHLADTISELGANGAPTAAYQNANFVLTGLLVVSFAVGLHRGVNEGRGSKWGPLLVAGFGALGLAASGLLPCDLGCSGETAADQLHFMAPTLGFPAMLAALFVLPRRLRQDARWQSHARYTKWTAWWCLSALIIFYLGVGGVVAPLQPVAGLLQRLFAWGIFLWIFVTGLRLFGLARE